MYYKKNIILKFFSLFCLVFCFTPLAFSANKIERECITSVESLTQTKEVLFVDVRAQQFFKMSRIPNSINVPLQLVSTKSFLKNKDVVLVGNGWNEKALIDGCNKLKNKGYKSVKVLVGGITSWFKMKNKWLKKTLISLSSKEFFNNKSEKKFVPFVISSSAKKQIATALPHAKIYPLKVTKKQLLKGLNGLGKGANPIVIFSENNQIVDFAINDYLRKPLRKIYYFEGGFSGYKTLKDLNEMTAMSNQHKRLSTKKPVSCAN